MDSEPRATDDTQRIVARPRVVIAERGAATREVPLGPTTVSIGRDPQATISIGLPTADNPVGLPDISRKHAQIAPQETGFVVVDLGSTNGTYLRGRRLPAQQPARLRDGDVIRIGDDHGNSVSITYREGAAGMSGYGTLSIGRVALGDRPRVAIGRDPASELHLDSPVVSLRHAEVVRTLRGHDLVDLGSTNGTFVNGTRVRRQALQRGDVIQIGPCKLIYSPAALLQFTHAGSVRLDGVRLYKEVPAGRQGRRVLLNDISVSVFPREFIAVVGGSGAGKTTLLDALNGARPAQRGQVLLNGDDLYVNFDAFRTSMGYVPQADILHTGLPVRRALRYTAALRLPPDTDAVEIDRRIESVLQMVDMLPQADVVIHRLSGGQRKRVSIASELLSEPSLLFLDEPTSGLDPGLDKKMMRTLSALADAGHTVILTTHATSNIVGYCDHVAFLAHGRLVYFGPPVQALQFFAAPDFATIYSKLETPAQAEQAEAQFRASPDYHAFVAQRQAAIPPQTGGAAAVAARRASTGLLASVRQFAILSRRYLDLIFGDRLSLFVLSAVMPLIGLLLMFIANPKSLIGDQPYKVEEIVRTGATHYYSIVQDTQRVLLMLGLSALLLGLFAAAYEIVKERPVYERERMINLGIAPYLGSKVAVLLGFGLVQCLLLLGVVALRVQMPAQGQFWQAPVEMYVSLVLALLVGLSLGLLISAATRGGNAVIYLVLMVLFFQLLFSGALFPLEGIAREASALTSTRWALQGLGASVHVEGDEGLNAMNRRLDPATLRVVPADPEPLFIEYPSTPVGLVQTWLVQLGFAAVFLLLAAIMLKRQDAH